MPDITAAFPIYGLLFKHSFTLLISQVVPAGWNQDKDYSTAGKLAQGDLVIVRRSDGSIRFGEILRKSGMFFQVCYSFVLALGTALLNLFPLEGLNLLHAFIAVRLLTFESDAQGSMGGCRHH